MKKLFFLTALLCASLMGWATPYCDEPLTLNGGAEIQLSCIKVSDGNYQIVIKGTNLNGLGGSFYNPGEVDLRSKVTTSTATLIVCDIEAASAPTLYTPLYVMCPLEQNIGWPNDVEWGECECEDKTKPAVSAVAVGSITHNSAVLTITASDNVAVTNFVVKNGDTQIATSKTNIITLTDLSAETTYSNIKVFAYDKCENESDAFAVESFTTEAAPSNIYTNLEIGHQGAQNPDINSYILLSVGSDGQGHTIVNIKQDAAKNTMKFDYINIVGIKDIGSDVTTGGQTEMAIVFNTPTPDGEGNITFNLQWSTVNWDGRWALDVTLPADATSTTADPFPGSNTYCDYTDNQMRSNNANVNLTWSTDASGNVVIDITDGEGATNSAYRNGGFENEGTFANTWFVYSGTNHATCEPATVYFNDGGTLSNNNKRFTLTKKATLPANAVIAFFGHAFSWTNTQAPSAYHEKKYFGYQYGYNCPSLDVPTDVAVTNAGVITFTGSALAETYTALVYLNGILKHRQTVTSGATLTYTPYVTGTYQVKVTASAEGYPTTAPSEPANWSLTAAPVVVGNSEYCEAALPTFVAEAVNYDANLTWETENNGSITITLSPNQGETAVFRAEGMKLADFTVGSITPASEYFNREYTAGGSTVILTLKDANVTPGQGEPIHFNGYVECKVNDTNTWPSINWTYTYGSHCTGQKHVSVAVNNNEWGTATVNGGASADVDPGTTVTCVAVPASGYEFVNWTKNGVEVATTATYEPTIDVATDLVANFDYERFTYCHTEVLTDGSPQYKVYLTVGKGATEGTYQVKIYGSDELTITGINLANSAVNHIKYLTYDQNNDVPLTTANGGWTFEDGVITSAELMPQTGHTWRDMWIWRPDLYIGTNHGEQVINNTLKLEHHFNWDNECAEDPGPGTAIDNTIAGEKAVKVIENGQLVIIKNGVKYNVLGGQL